MKLYCYRDPIGNFGDDLNLWLWPKLVPGIFDCDDGPLFIGIGTLLNHRVPAMPKKVVLGTGAGYGEPPTLDDRWSIYGVRGPLSARMLGLGQEYALSDPAMLVGQLETLKKEKVHAVSVMPHHRSTFGIPWKRYCAIAGVNYLDPRTNIFDLMRGIKNSDVVVTEAMHGAIVADAFRVPWIPLKLFEHVLSFKWEDWCASIGVPYEPITRRVLMNFHHGLRSRWNRTIQPLSLIVGLRRMAERVAPVLSTDAAFDQAVSRLQDAVARLRADYLSAPSA